MQDGGGEEEGERVGEENHIGKTVRRKGIR